VLWRSKTVDTSAFETESGWQFKPEGACKGDVCVPLQRPPGTQLDVLDIAQQLGMPVVVDDTHNLVAVGPEAVAARALTTAAAPHLTLPDLSGTPFDLASLRGNKVLVYAWAPY